MRESKPEDVEKRRKGVTELRRKKWEASSMGE